MALTNFAALTNEQKTAWSREIWKMARNSSFIQRVAGSGPNSIVQRVTELKQSDKGARAVITLVADLEGDGVAGDNSLEGREEPIKSYEKVIRIDQLRHANRHKGRLAEQKSVVTFREESRDVLAYWLGDRCDQLAFLTMSGVAYTQQTNGAVRTNSELPLLEFAADVQAPSAARFFRWTAAGALAAGNTASVTAADTPSYKMLVALKAQAKSTYMRGVRASGNDELYHVFMHPYAMAKLKLDADYIANLRSGGVRGGENPLFTGATVTVDGLVIHEHRHVYNTTGTATKWGAGNAIEGCRILFCGAQALGMADIGAPEWVEKEFDYENQPGISIGKMFGFVKPNFYSIYTKSVEDFGVITCDVAI